MDKKTLRTLFLQRRKTLEPRMHKMFNYMLMDQLTKLIKEHKAKRVGVFYPINNEVDVRDLGREFELYYPKIEQGKIVFYKDTGAFYQAPFHTFEPDSDEAIDKNELDVVVVPGLVFDQAGYRIGYGKGYYDMFLSDYKGFKVGVAMELFMVERLPKEAHDVCVDVVVTDNRILRGES